jgi:cephalosporin-C deacetylase-like acetyl esterase
MPENKEALVRRHSRRVPLFFALAFSAGLAVSQEQTGAVRLTVVPDRPGWTYATGDAVKFRVQLTRDGHPLAGSEITWSYGPEQQPATATKTEAVPADGHGLLVSAGTLKQPGFLRLTASTEVAGRKYRAVGTAGYAPDRIQPTVEDPPDFDAFWRAGKDALAKLPVDARLTLLPELSTSKVDVYHVSLQNVDGEGRDGTSRFYGILAEPRAEGRYPALLSVPGAGVRPYRGLIDVAERGFVTLQVGIHGLPVNLDVGVYDSLRTGGLAGYPVVNLDDKNRYYYRRVYLGCVRGNDFLVTRPKWDGKNLGVTGGSQGGALSIVTAGLDPRVTVLAAYYPALSDVTGYVKNRAGGWPHMFRDEKLHRSPEKLATARYYDVVNFARRVKAPGLYSWGFNDETCPPTSMYAAYNVIAAPKSLLLALETGHFTTPEQVEKVNRWLEGTLRNGTP